MSMKDRGLSNADIGEELGIMNIPKRLAEIVEAYRSQHVVDSYVARNLDRAEQIIEAFQPAAIGEEPDKDAAGVMIKAMIFQHDTLGVTKQKPAEQVPNVTISFNGVDAPVAINQEAVTPQRDTSMDPHDLELGR